MPRRRRGWRGSRPNPSPSLTPTLTSTLTPTLTLILTPTLTLTPNQARLKSAKAAGDGVDTAREDKLQRGATRAFARVARLEARLAALNQQLDALFLWLAAVETPRWRRAPRHA